MVDTLIFIFRKRKIHVSIIIQSGQQLNKVRNKNLIISLTIFLLYCPDERTNNFPQFTLKQFLYYIYVF